MVLSLRYGLAFQNQVSVDILGYLTLYLVTPHPDPGVEKMWVVARNLGRCPSESAVMCRGGACSPPREAVIQRNIHEKHDVTLCPSLDEEV